MGEFRRTRSRVWWGGREEGVALSPSPCASHKSHDSGFSDCEARFPLCFELSFDGPAHTSTPKSAATPPAAQRRLRPACLLRDFQQEDSERNPVKQWLQELGKLYEPECMTTLQSKSLAVDLNRQIAVMAAATNDTVRELQQHTKLISSEFTKLCQQLEYGLMDHIAPLVQSVVGLMTEFLNEYGHFSKKHKQINKNEEDELIKACNVLKNAAAQNNPQNEFVTKLVSAVGQQFTNIVDAILSQEISILIGMIEEPKSELALRSAVCSLTNLGLEGQHMCFLVAQCGGVRALLGVCLDSKCSTLRASALRTLATICCVESSIRKLEQAGGIEILAEILMDSNRPETELSEAAAVLAQITAPWVEDNHNINGLAEQLPAFVQSLTKLVKNTKSSETLLLAAAALANMTFLEPRAVWPMIEYDTAGVLLTAVRQKGPTASVFLQEQAATLLANMATIPESRDHLAKHRAVVALLCFLQIRHSPLQRAPEIAAAERVLQKSAIALSRLCCDTEVAQQVIELQGLNRLVRLCKEERERNHSDGVLVACLAALRKIAANCGTKAIEDLDAMELVEPSLLDSFLIYSSRQESYV